MKPSPSPPKKIQVTGTQYFDLVFRSFWKRTPAQIKQLQQRLSQRNTSVSNKIQQRYENESPIMTPLKQVTLFEDYIHESTLMMSQPFSIY